MEVQCGVPGFQEERYRCEAYGDSVQGNNSLNGEPASGLATVMGSETLALSLWRYFAIRRAVFAVSHVYRDLPKANYHRRSIVDVRQRYLRA